MVPSLSLPMENLDFDKNGLVCVGACVCVGGGGAGFEK